MLLSCLLLPLSTFFSTQQTLIAPRDKVYSTCSQREWRERSSAHEGWLNNGATPMNSSGVFIWLLSLCFSNLVGFTEGKVTGSSTANVGSDFWQLPDCLATLWDLCTLLCRPCPSYFLSTGKLVLENCWWASFSSLPTLPSLGWRVQPLMLQQTPTTAQTEVCSSMWI